MSENGDIVTFSELRAYHLIYRDYGDTHHDASTVHQAADKIILLAEKIKAERITSAMINASNMLREVKR